MQEMDLIPPHNNNIVKFGLPPQTVYSTSGNQLRLSATGLNDYLNQSDIYNGYSVPYCAVHSIVSLINKNLSQLPMTIFICRTNLDPYQAICMDLPGLHFFVSCDVAH